MPLPGTTQGVTTPQYGGVPTVPSPEESLAQALYGTSTNLGGLYGLAGQTNQFNAAQAAGQYAANLPLYGPMTQQASTDIYSNLQGQLPPDVVQQLQQRAAERGVQTGAAGGPNQNAAYLRALGLTSLDLENLGQTQLSQAVARTPTGPLFDPSKFYITPADQSQAQLLANIYASAPNPTAAAENALRLAQQGLIAGHGAGAGGAGGGLPGGGAPSTAPGGPVTTPQATVSYPGTGGGAGSPTAQGYQAWLNALPRGAAQTQQGVQPMYGDLTSQSFLNPSAPPGSDTSAFYPSLGQDFQAGMALPPEWSGPNLEDLFPGFTTPDQTTPPDWQAGVALPPETGSYTQPAGQEWQPGVALPPDTGSAASDPFAGIVTPTEDWSTMFEDFVP